MVFIADINGTTKCVESTPIYQNSANVNKVVLLCPQPGNMMATVSFILPNGMATTPELMTNEGNDLIVDSNDNHLNAWSVTLKAPVTEYAGTCFVQFFFYPGFTDGQANAISPTYRTSFTISPGVPTEFPDIPSKDIYQQILNAMSRYNGSRANQFELFGMNAYHLETWCDMLDADSTDNFISNRMNATESFEISEGANDGQLLTTESITIPLSSQEWTVTLDASTGMRTLVEIVGENNFIKITGRGSGEYIISSSFSNNTAYIQYVADDDNIVSIAYSSNKLTVYHNANAVLSEDITFIPFTTVYIGGQSTSNVSYTISTVKIHNVCLTANEVTPLLSEATYRREKIENGEKYKLDVEMTFAQAIARTTKELITRGEFDESTRALKLYDSEDQVISVPLPELALKNGSAASISWRWVDEDANILEVSLKNASDEVISSVEIDLPIEQVVESGRYDSATRSIILVLSSGDEIVIPIEDFATDLATKSEFNTLKTYVETEIENISNTVDSIDDNVVKPSTKVEEETVEYIKSIPSDSASYVSIKKIGGMSVKDGNTLKNANVTVVKSIGVNVFNLINRTYGEIDSNGDLKLTGRETVLYEYPFKALTQYTLSGYVKNENTTGNVRLSINYTDGTQDPVALFNGSTTYTYKTFTTQANKTIASVNVSFGDAGAMYIKGGELMINEGIEALPYTPYFEHTLAIPEAVQSIEGYGQSNPNNAEEYNYIDFENDKFISYGHIVNGEWVSYSSKQETNIDIGDNRIRVQGGGTLTFENEYAIAVPNLVTEYTGNNDAISSDIFVGNLLGNVNGNSDTASALKDASGNKTYNDIVALMHNYVEAQLITIPNRLIEGENSFKNAHAVAAYVSSGYWKMVLQFTINALSIKMNNFSVTLDGNPSHQYTINDIEYTFNNNTLSVTISTRFQSDAFLNEADAKNTIGAGNYSYTAFR